MKEIKWRCKNCNTSYYREEFHSKEKIEKRLEALSGCDSPDLEEVGSRV
jgi:hypothetical protein